MEEETYQKAVKNAKWFAVGLFVLAIVSLGINIFMKELNIVAIVLGVLQICTIIGTIKGFSDQKKYGAICGIIVSVLLILNRDILSIIFGILYLLDCIKILNNQRKKEK